MNVDRDIISALMKLTEKGDLTQQVKDALANLVCLLYCPRGIHITSIPDLRWDLFCKHLTEISKLPPTVAALEEHIERVRVQIRVWCQATMMSQHLFDSHNHGYYHEGSTCTKGIVEFVRCQCKAHCTSQRCPGRRYNLACTDLSLCGSDCKNDAHSNTENDTQDSDEDL